jgi:hypothetical protein
MERPQRHQSSADALDEPAESGCCHLCVLVAHVAHSNLDVDRLRPSWRETNIPNALSFFSDTAKHTEEKREQACPVLMDLIINTGSVVSYLVVGSLSLSEIFLASS